MTTPKKPIDPTRARGTPPPVYLRVRHIRRLMELDLWAVDQIDDLADEWGVSTVCVRTHSAEASRQLEAVLDATKIARSILADTDAAIILAFEQGDPATVGKLQEIRLKLAGAGVHRDERNDPLASNHKQPERPFWEEPN